MGIDDFWMQEALALAEMAKKQGEVPVGAVLVKGNQKIAEGFNSSIALHDPSAHAEIQVLREAGKRLKNYRLPDTTLYVTLEPCMMCQGALVQARVARIVFGAWDKKDLLNHHAILQGGVLEQECAHLLSHFFKEKRKKAEIEDA